MMDMTYEGLNYDTFSLRTLERGVKEMTRLPYHKQVLAMNQTLCDRTKRELVSLSPRHSTSQLQQMVLQALNIKIP